MGFLGQAENAALRVSAKGRRAALGAAGLADSAIGQVGARATGFGKGFINSLSGGTLYMGGPRPAYRTATGSFMSAYQAKGTNLWPAHASAYRAGLNLGNEVAGVGEVGRAIGRFDPLGIGKGLGTGIAEGGRRVMQSALQKTPEAWNNLYTGLKMNPVLGGAIGVGAMGIAAAKGWFNYERRRATGRLSYTGNMPALSYDYNAQMDRSTGKRDFGSVSDGMGASGDLVLALNRLR